MAGKNNQEEILFLSFLTGIIAFFALSERRTTTLRRNISSTSPSDNIKKDWLKVGSDLTRSYKKLAK